MKGHPHFAAKTLPSSKLTCLGVVQNVGSMQHNPCTPRATNLSESKSHLFPTNTIGMSSIVPIKLVNKLSWMNSASRNDRRLVTLYIILRTTAS